MACVNKHIKVRVLISSSPSNNRLAEKFSVKTDPKSERSFSLVFHYSYQSKQEFSTGHGKFINVHIYFQDFH